MASLRLNRIKKRSDFVRLTTHGKSIVTSSFIIQALETRSELSSPDACRVGFTASKKIGNAVMRSRAKRRMRAVCAEHLAQHGRAGMDYVLVGRKFCVQSSYETLCKDFVFALRKVHA